MINIYNIAFDEISFAERDVVFENIGDLSNPKPDLYEYHHIIKFYDESRTTWNENEFYGFLSTNFYMKTGLEGNEILAKIGSNLNGKKIILLNPWWRLFQSSMNSWHQGEENHPGLIDCFLKCMNELNIEFEYEDLFANSKNTTYSNFFLAKPIIWDEWIRIVKVILHIANDSNHYLNTAHNAPTKYKIGTSPKMLIFVLERIINVLLAKKNKEEIASIETFSFAMDSINRPPSHVKEIDRLRIEYENSAKKKYDDLISLMWQQKKIVEIEKLSGAKLFKSAVSIVKSEIFSSIFQSSVEMQKIKILYFYGNYSEALTRAQKAVKTYRDDALAFEILIVRLHSKIGNFKEARLVLEKLFELYPTSHVLVCDFITVLLKLRDFSLCIEMTNFALAQFPRSWLVPFIASKLCAEINQSDKAQAYMLEASRIKNSRRRIEWNMS